MSVRFMGKFPVFGKTKRTGKGTGEIRDTEKGVAYTKSAYFYWWKALTLSDRYKKVCESNGAEGNDKIKKVYADFGDVFSTDFETWWKAHGLELFGEVASSSAVLRLKTTEVDEHKALIDSGETLLLAISLDFTKRDIASAVRKIVAKNHGGKRGRLSEADRIRNSKARYKLYHFRSIEGLRQALRVVEGVKAGKMLKTLGRKNEYRTNISRSKKVGLTLIKYAEQGNFPISVER